MIGRHCPIYAVNREVTLRIQALQFCSDHKFAFSSLGFRVFTGFDSDTETGGLHWSWSVQNVSDFFGSLWILKILYELG